MDIKKEILFRVYFVLGLLVLPMAGLLVYKTFFLAVIEGEKWREKAEKYLEYRPIEAERGNIYAADGSLLATSIPYYDVYFDPLAPKDEDFNRNKDSLAFYLSKYADTKKTKEDYLLILDALRESSDRHILIKKNISFAEKDLFTKFPLFRLGRFRGGFIIEKRSERKRPFGLLAQRTIGYVREEALPIGLEGYYDKVLGGQPGQQLMFQVGKEIWMPVEDLAQIHPKSGLDIQTTIDINLQDITQQALLKAMKKHDATWGAAIIMEVSTGSIKAISNLGAYQQTYLETYNYAIGTGIEPGSTFKLASIMALLEDDYVHLNDSIDIEGGVTKFYDEVLKDSSPRGGKTQMVSVRSVFEKSSNVGVAKLVSKYYQNQPEKFIKRLQQFRLDQPTGIKIMGEAAPYIKNPNSKEDQWSGITLPWMSIGYELRLTPLQIASFYNAIANNGNYMQPYLVSEIQSNGVSKELFTPQILKSKIASAATLEKAKDLLEGVVKNGTAKSLQHPQFTFAGKTGTSQINYRKVSNETLIGGYQASFVGYFPTDQPKYTCLVVINNPRKGGYYGSDVAGPVFREIAVQAFSSRMELNEVLNSKPKAVFAAATFKDSPIGMAKDFTVIAEQLKMATPANPPTQVAAVQATSDGIALHHQSIPDDLVPDVRGMGLRDAIYLLENRGLKTIVRGSGRVLRQSILPGTRINGQKVTLYLK